MSEEAGACATESRVFENRGKIDTARFVDDVCGVCATGFLILQGTGRKRLLLYH